MEIIEVNAEEFSRIINSPYHIFGGSTFTEINKNKADSIHYFLFKDVKYRLGLTFGIKEETLFSPFSAPFGGFVFLGQEVKINYIDKAICKLLNWARREKVKFVKTILPPNFYNEIFISKQVNSFFRNGFSIENVDLNYSMDFENFNSNYIKNIWYNARKNLKIANKNEFVFKVCNLPEDYRLVYEIIKKNRKSRGYPIRMSWNEIKITSSIIPSDFFLVYNSKNLPCASAIVFHSSVEIVQVIYWGDIIEYSGLRTMNYLSYQIFEYYKKLGIKHVDIGPSTENSIPNYGLCEFKESIGCNISTKFSLTKTII